MLAAVLRAYSVIKAKLLNRPLALCDISDVDGIVCAALFRMRYPRGEVVLAAPSDVRGGRLLRSVEWTFVADLPCPGRALIRADHHASNPPCASREFYDPSAPAAAVLALRALGLEGVRRAERLVALAVETDTARIASPEALALNDAVKGSGYRGKLRLVELLAARPLEEVLSDPKVSEAIERFKGVREATERLAAELPPLELFVAVFKEDLGLSYRHLCILMERRGSKLTAVVVPRGAFTTRVYLGSASRDLDVSKVAVRLGGGGHPYAAGATLRSLTRGRAVERILLELKRFLGLESLDVVLIDRRGFEVRRWPAVGS